jgi:hypothetical protein
MEILHNLYNSKVFVSNQFAMKNRSYFLEFLAMKIEEQGFCNNITGKAIILVIGK